MIVVRLSGGMGNQMFQYAIGRSLAIKNNVPLKLDTTFLLQRVSFPSLLRPQFVFRSYDLDVYTVAASIATTKDMKWWQRPITTGKLMVGIDAVLRKIPILSGWEKTFSYDDHIMSSGPDTYLAGFWQSPKYFNGIREVLIKDFTLVNSLSAESAALQSEISNCNAVCIHVRRSDIAGKSFHGGMDTNYYTKGLESILNKTKVDKLYVFSDDIEWCKNNLHFDVPIMYVGPEYAGTKGEGHMMLMRSCKHFIIPNSTYSWWAAWLATGANKIVVAPKQWFSNTTIDTSDLFPEDWLRI